MEMHSYDYLAPLLHAHSQGRWGSPRRDAAQVHYYVALQTLAHERGLPCRRVKLVVPHYMKGGALRDAIIPGLILFQADTPVLLDLHGNMGPEDMIGDFVRSYTVEPIWNDDFNSLESWKDAPALGYPAGSPSWDRLDAVINSGRAMLQAFWLQETRQAEPSKPAPIPRM